MKKIILAAAAAITLVACGKTETIYVVDSLPENLETTQAPATTQPVQTTKPKPRPTTPQSYYTYSEQAYIDSMYSLYSGVIYLSDDELLNIAYTICDTLNTGVSLNAVVAVLASELPNTSDATEFTSALLAAAIFNICPQHKWQIPTN